MPSELEAILEIAENRARKFRVDESTVNELAYEVDHLQLENERLRAALRVADEAFDRAESGMRIDGEHYRGLILAALKGEG